MGWFRRPRDAEVPATSHETLPDLAIAPRLERALVALAVHAQQLDTRLERLERRLDADAEALLAYPTQADIIEVQVHSARVAAEITRLAVELRAEIAEVAAAQRGDDAQRAARTLKLAPPLTPPQRNGALHAQVGDFPPAASA